MLPWFTGSNPPHPMDPLPTPHSPSQPDLFLLYHSIMPSAACRHCPALWSPQSVAASARTERIWALPSLPVLPGSGLSQSFQFSGSPSAPSPPGLPVLPGVTCKGGFLEEGRGFCLFGQMHADISELVSVMKGADDGEQIYGSCLFGPLCSGPHPLCRALVRLVPSTAPPTR